MESRSRNRVRQLTYSCIPPYFRTFKAGRSTSRDSYRTPSIPRGTWQYIRDRHTRPLFPLISMSISISSLPRLNKDSVLRTIRAQAKETLVRACKLHPRVAKLTSSFSGFQPVPSSSVHQSTADPLPVPGAAPPRRSHS